VTNEKSVTIVVAVTLWARFKKKCIDRNMTIKQALTEALDKWILGVG
jgi:hypothetical protein